MLELLDPAASTAQSLADHLAGVSVGLLALGVALHVAKMGARARAWHNIASAAYPEERLRFRHALGAYVCGTGTNAVIPARPGELVKLGLLHRKAPGAAYPGLASTLVTESLFDMVVAVLAVAAGLALGWASFGGSLPGPFASLARHPGLVGAGAAVGAGVAIALRRPALRLLRRATTGASRGFSVLRRPSAYLGSVASWQLGALGLRLASILCFLAAFHVPATLQTALLVIAVQSVSNLVPLTPNGAVTQQALLVLALGSSAGAASVVGFGAGAQLATVAAEVVLAAVSFVLMTGSLRWRGLIKPEPGEPASAYQP
jgi:Lysylphosphatidylglycerol synthase TM region